MNKTMKKIATDFYSENKDVKEHGKMMRVRNTLRNKYLDLKIKPKHE